MPQRPKISRERARRLTLHAQGLDRPRPTGAVDVRHLRGVLDRNAVVQLDAVNVSARAHEMVFFSRLGRYRRSRLEAFLWHRGENFEHWGHEASVMPVELHPLMRHRMARHPWRGVQRLAEEQPGFIETVLDAVADRGPLSISELSPEGVRGGSWWGWKPARVALHWLWVTGRLAVHHRDAQFRLYYDLPERVLPAQALDAPTPPRETALERLLLLAARAHGLGTAHDLADHFRVGVREARPLLERLVAGGALEQVEVVGWSEPAFRHPEAVTPHRVEARALLSPFDPLVWFRPRAERLFDFRYRIEIYTPAPQRRYGYYVLPFLLGERLAARVDLKSDRTGSRLRVLGAFAEAGEDHVHVARELTQELRSFAEWQGLDGIEVADRGDLAPALRRAASR